MLQSDFSQKNLTTLPNLLTYLRIASIPLIVILLYPPVSGRSFNFAFTLFLFASLTDWLDGIVARHQNQITSVGKLLDPLADKLLTSAVLIMLIPLNKVPAWLVFVILSREIIITGLRSIAASQGLILSASRLGKNKMISQTVALHFLLIYIPRLRIMLNGIGTALLWISVILSYWSAGDYFVEFYQQGKRHQRAGAKTSTE